MRASKNVPISSSSRMSSSSLSQTARRRSNPIERRLSFRRIRIRRAGSCGSSVHAPSSRLHARVRALGRCVRDHSSLSRGQRRRGHEPTYSRSRRVVISFVSAVDTTLPTQTRRARLPVCAWKPLGGQVVFTARTLSRPIVDAVVRVSGDFYYKIRARN